jgi:glyoxylase I family protein
VFGLERLEEAVFGGHRLVALVDRGTDIAINLHVHEGNRRDAFDERQTGLDHLSLLVEDRRSLDVWSAHLDTLGVPHSPIVDEHYGSVLVFRDPDGIQLELFCNPSVPDLPEALISAQAAVTASNRCAGSVGRGHSVTARGARSVTVGRRPTSPRG